MPFAIRKFLFALVFLLFQHLSVFCADVQMPRCLDRNLAHYGIAQVEWTRHHVFIRVSHLGPQNDNAAPHFRSRHSRKTARLHPFYGITNIQQPLFIRSALPDGGTEDSAISETTNEYEGEDDDVIALKKYSPGGKAFLVPVHTPTLRYAGSCAPKRALQPHRFFYSASYTCALLCVMRI